ncbi:hypothetical protein M407DRAFT_91986 [Tulasnella calospora MUT 4182]|uniref:Uncharacterized protein n=1 Tax=Tulasnella calospora MUT 4182 TaxID=1051891 RepID=A0A0C3KVF2_9AGAM|nr:hypothetical protein M407DRAFT_91986 [Tulasnella calospora MUT 4182]
MTSSFHDSEISYRNPGLVHQFHDIATTDRTTDTGKKERRGTGNSSSKAIDKRRGEERERIKKDETETETEREETLNDRRGLQASSKERERETTRMTCAHIRQDRKGKRR